jgi:hypothetical protein
MGVSVNIYPGFLPGAYTFTAPDSMAPGYLFHLGDGTTDWRAVDLSAYAKTASLATVATSGKYADLIDKPTTFTPSAHQHVATDVSDSTPTGRSVLTAADAAAARAAIGIPPNPTTDGVYTLTCTVNAGVGALEWVLAGGAYSPSLDFSNSNNSMYLGSIV